MNSPALLGAGCSCLRQPDASGAVTAEAVGVFRALDQEIRKRTKGQHNLDDVARELASDYRRPVSLKTLREVAERIVGGSVEALALDQTDDERKCEDVRRVLG